MCGKWNEHIKGHRLTLAFDEIVESLLEKSVFKSIKIYFEPKYSPRFVFHNVVDDIEFTIAGWEGSNLQKDPTFFIEYGEKQFDVNPLTATLFVNFKEEWEKYDCEKVLERPNYSLLTHQ
jgi:hypothetical protein